MLVDRFSLRRKLQQIAEILKEEKPADRLLQEVVARIESSSQIYAARRAALPCPEFSQDLPVNLRKDEIAAAVAAHQVVIVCGETGSGKTTQLPKICLE